MTQPFRCDRCGLCCKQIAKVKPGWPTRPDGSCVFLTPDNLCQIYAVRPEECNVELTYALHFAQAMGWEEYCAANEAVCDQLKAEDPQGDPHEKAETD